MGDNIRIGLKEIVIRGIGLIWVRIQIIGEPCECGIESLGSISHGVGCFFFNS